jgi:16S rRNA (cytosine1402-N4)-methyltransferase
MEFHESVLLKESIEALCIKPDGVFVDATFGGGGHSREILKRLGEKGRLYAFDQDEDAIKNSLEDPRFIMINTNFRYLKNFLKLYKAVPVDGILADLGISSHQIDTAERGFSTRYDSILDMRMDRKATLSAKDLVNKYEEEKLKEVFSLYGEIRNSSKLAKAIVSARREKEIRTTEELKEIIQPFIFKGNENKYLAQLFQAIRIEVNQELAALRDFLRQSNDILQQGGRLVIISYHSLEDKLVKNFFRSGNFEGEPVKDFYGNPLVPFKVINRKPLVPASDEISRNKRARSAKLRIAEKL